MAARPGNKNAASAGTSKGWFNNQGRKVRHAPFWEALILGFHLGLNNFLWSDQEGVNIQVECSSFPLAARAVAKGSMAAILPSIAAGDLKESGVEVVTVPFLKHFERAMCLASNTRLIRIRPVLQRVAVVLAQACRL